MTEVVVQSPSLEMPVGVNSTGQNAALARWSDVGTDSTALLYTPSIETAWKKAWTRPKTFGLTFPEGVEFLPAKKEKPELKREDKPRARTAPKTRTKVKPPSNALSIKDKLFYLLQPPIETWLAGQEMLMPFEPFRYQYEGVAWLFGRQSGLLADEMGLGKTMQTIVAIRMLLRSSQVRRVLIICPKPLIPNWIRELNLWAEEIPVAVVEGKTAKREVMWSSPQIPVLLCNYEVMARDLRNVPEEMMPRFDLVVLDEAQRIKNKDSTTAEVARSIPRQRSYLLTGTPIENRPEELVSLFEFLEILPKNSEPDLKQLRKLSEGYILRRTKELAQPDMPPRLDNNAIIDLAPSQRAAYDFAEKEGIVRLNDLGDEISVSHVFELVLRLKQISNYDPVTNESSKLERLLADMEEISASGGKAILFSQWTKTLDWLQERTKQFGCLVYHGGVPHKKREPILDQFKNDPSKHIILMSYGTGAVGLNLQFAGYVFLYDRWWNPAIEDQAVNRAHRVGVKTKVIVNKFICKDTVEERIDRVLNEKRAIFEAVLGDGDALDDDLTLSAKDIFGLFDLRKKEADGGSKAIAPKAA